MADGQFPIAYQQPERVQAVARWLQGLHPIARNVLALLGVSPTAPPGPTPLAMTIAGPAGRLGTPQELGQLLGGWQSMPEGIRTSLAQVPEQYGLRPTTALPEDMGGLASIKATPEGKLGGLAQIASRPGAEVSTAHELGHLADPVSWDPIMGRVRSAGDTLAAHPAAQPAVQALQRLGYGPESVPRELVANLMTPERDHPVVNALQDAIMNPEFRSLATSVLESLRTQQLPTQGGAQ